MRTATINRTTTETDIRLSLALEGAGKAEINTGCGFLNHFLPHTAALTFPFPVRAIRRWTITTP